MSGGGRVGEGAGDVRTGGRAAGGTRGSEPGGRSPRPFRACHPAPSVGALTSGVPGLPSVRLDCVQASLRSSPATLTRKGRRGTFGSGGRAAGAPGPLSEAARGRWERGCKCAPQGSGSTVGGEVPRWKNRRGGRCGGRAIRRGGGEEDVGEMGMVKGSRASSGDVDFRRRRSAGQRAAIQAAMESLVTSQV